MKLDLYKLLESLEKEEQNHLFNQKLEIQKELKFCADNIHSVPLDEIMRKIQSVLITYNSFR